MMQLVSFLYGWQELIGAFLGPFLAVILSAIAYLVGKQYEKVQSELEAMRRLEVSVSYELSSIVNMHAKLTQFVGSARELIAEIESETDPRTFAFQTINFPAIGLIYLDERALEMPTKSYYIHNKLLWIHAGTQDVNNILATLHQGLERVLRINDKLFELMRQNPNPPEQRRAYAENLRIFSDEIERFANEDLKKGVIPLLQVKIYNNKLRNGWLRGMKVRWEFEGSKSWLIRKIFNYDEPKRELRYVDMMDSILQPEVDIELSKAEQRLRETNG